MENPLGYTSCFSIISCFSSSVSFSFFFSFSICCSNIDVRLFNFSSIAETGFSFFSCSFYKLLNHLSSFFFLFLPCLLLIATDSFTIFLMSLSSASSTAAVISTTVFLKKRKNTFWFHGFNIHYNRTIT